MPSTAIGDSFQVGGHYTTMLLYRVPLIFDSSTIHATLRHITLSDCEFMNLGNYGSLCEEYRSRDWKRWVVRRLLLAF